MMRADNSEYFADTALNEAKKLRDDGKAREQMVEKERDHLLDRQKPDAGTR